MNNIIANIIPCFVITLVYSYGFFMLYDWERENKTNEKKKEK